jgi:hypothetical protein
VSHKKKSTAWMDDGDDAHFVAAKKRSRKRVANNFAPTKRVAGKKRTKKRTITKR